MALGQTNISFGAVYWEIFRTNTPANLTLEHLVSNSRLSNKSKPYNLGDFRGYDGNPTVTMTVSTADDTNYRYVNVSFHKSFETKFTTTVFYTINRNDGQQPVMQSIDMVYNHLIYPVDFQVERRTADYQVSITLEYCNHANSTTITQTITVPAKVVVPPTETLPTQRGREDAQYDNMYNPDYGVARPYNWGYSVGTTAYNEYMTAYNRWRMTQN